MWTLNDIDKIKNLINEYDAYIAFNFTDYPVIIYFKKRTKNIIKNQQKNFHGYYLFETAGEYIFYWSYEDYEIINNELLKYCVYQLNIPIAEYFTSGSYAKQLEIWNILNE